MHRQSRSQSTVHGGNGYGFGSGIGCSVQKSDKVVFEGNDSFHAVVVAHDGEKGAFAVVYVFGELVRGQVGVVYFRDVKDELQKKAALLGFRHVS